MPSYAGGMAERDGRSFQWEEEEFVNIYSVESKEVGEILSLISEPINIQISYTMNCLLLSSLAINCHINVKVCAYQRYLENT